MRSGAACVVLLGLAACSSAPSATTAEPARSAAAVTPAPAPTPTEASEAEAVFLPAPGAKLPHKSRALAAELVEVSDALEDSLQTWIEEGDPARGRPPRRVTLQGLYQQRIYRLMARREDLGRRTLQRLDGGLERFARTTIKATRKLRSLVSPLPRSATLRTGRPESAGDLRSYFARGQRRYDVDWEVLAAVNYVESKFGRVRSNSTAGAQGPMQFLPSTWDAYGLGGDIQDPRDAILGAANYLHASGAPGDYRKALYAYNHSERYVDAILLFTRAMRREARHYFDYYSWQVFIITTKGDKRLTGPGLD